MRSVPSFLPKYPTSLHRRVEKRNGKRMRAPGLSGWLLHLVFRLGLGLGLGSAFNNKRRFQFHVRVHTPVSNNGTRKNVHFIKSSFFTLLNKLSQQVLFPLLSSSSVHPPFSLYSSLLPPYSPLLLKKRIYNVSWPERGGCFSSIYINLALNCCRI